MFPGNDGMKRNKKIMWLAPSIILIQRFLKNTSKWPELFLFIWFSSGQKHSSQSIKILFLSFFGKSNIKSSHNRILLLRKCQHHHKTHLGNFSKKSWRFFLVSHWCVWKSAVEDGEVMVPQHRIQQIVYRQRHVVWEKLSRTDLVFGSTGYRGTINDFIGHLERHASAAATMETPHWTCDLETVYLRAAMLDSDRCLWRAIWNLGNGNKHWISCDFIGLIGWFLLFANSVDPHKEIGQSYHVLLVATGMGRHLWLVGGHRSSHELDLHVRSPYYKRGIISFRLISNVWDDKATHWIERILSDWFIIAKS